MKSNTYVKIKADDLVALYNEISLLRARLDVYEPPQKPITLLNSDGSPKGDSNTHPFFKPGPKGVLETLPDKFSYEDVVRAKGGGDQRHTINMWKHRGYITCGENDQYIKTDKWKARLKQTKLTKINNGNVLQAIDKKENGQ